MNRSRSEGFTVVEMLVVMLIIAALAAIAVPIIASQRGKATDVATRNDVRTVGLGVLDWFSENTNPPEVTIVDGRFRIGGQDAGAASAGSVFSGADPALADTTAWSRTGWCISLTNPRGDTGTFRVSHAGQVVAGTCATPTSP